MSSITIHLIDKNGYYDSTLTSDADNALNMAESEGLGYTMTQPPEDCFIKRYRWINNEWIADDTAE